MFVSHAITHTHTQYKGEREGERESWITQHEWKACNHEHQREEEAAAWQRCKGYRDSSCVTHRCCSEWAPNVWLNRTTCGSLLYRNYYEIQRVTFYDGFQEDRQSMEAWIATFWIASHPGGKTWGDTQGWMHDTVRPVHPLRAPLQICGCLS